MLLNIVNFWRTGLRMFYRMVGENGPRIIRIKQAFLRTFGQNSSKFITSENNLTPDWQIQQFSQSKVVLQSNLDINGE